MAESTSPRPTLWEAALGAWRSPRLFALAMLAVAVILGGWLRFHRLTLTDMNADEGQTWAGAIAPDLPAVMAAEQRIETMGKSALYDIVLHEWIGLFGDSLYSMRALSAGFGTIAIILLFAAVREVWRSLGGVTIEVGEVTAAFAALIYATNVTMVLSSRTVRMYPLVMCAEFLQILLFVRAQRQGKLHNYAGVAVFTALMVAANFSSSFLLVAEALWLAALLVGRLAGTRAGGLAIFRPALAVVAGLVLLTPMLSSAVSASVRGVRVGVLDFIPPRPVWWPFMMLRAAVGTDMLFDIFVILGVFGLWRQRRTAPLASGFFAAWMVGPLLAMLGVTYLIHPLEVMRYVLVAFAGLFALAGLGAASVGSTVVRVTLAGLIICLGLLPTRYVIRHPRADVAWSAATAVAIQAASDHAIGVIPGYAVYSVRYYLPRDGHNTAIGLWTCGSPRVVIFSGWSWLPADETAKVKACYPRVIRRLYKVEVRSR